MSSNTDVVASFQQLHALSSLIQTSIISLERICTDHNTLWPSLDTPVYSSLSSSEHKNADVVNIDFLRVNNPDVSKAVATIVAAAFQLITSVRDPHLTVLEGCCEFNHSSALRIVTELHIVDILRDAGNEGLLVDEIASKVNVDESNLARILRLLATRHVFNEIRPNVFTNNRISAVLEKGQNISTLISNPAGKYDKPESALPTYVSLFTDIMFKSSSVLFETLVDPNTAFSGSPGRCVLAKSAELNLNPMQKSSVSLVKSSLDDPTNSSIPSEEVAIIIRDGNFPELSLFDLLAHDESVTSPLMFSKERLRRFGVAMRATGSVPLLVEILQGFEFASLPPSTALYDVGGGIGFVAEILLQKHENLKVVIQDRPEVSEEGIEKWKTTFPGMLDSGRIAFQVHDFLSPQPQSREPASVYFLKHILHNWSDQYATVILKHLRQAVEDDVVRGSERVRLLIVDAIMPYATQIGSSPEDGLDGDTWLVGKHTDSVAVKTSGELLSSVSSDAPSPLLANWGSASLAGYYMDSTMLTALNGVERTLAHIRTVLHSSGWKIVKVTRSRITGEFLAMIEAVAV